MICTDCTSYLWMLAWRWSNEMETCCHNKMLIFINCCCVVTIILKHSVLLLEFKHNGMSLIKTPCALHSFTWTSILSIVCSIPAHCGWCVHTDTYICTHSNLTNSHYRPPALAPGIPCHNVSCCWGLWPATAHVISPHTISICILQPILWYIL